MAKRNKGKAAYGNNNEKQTWQDESKEQISLAMGTPEYREYQEDLMEHDPFRPNDEWHEELEQSYDELVDDRREQSEEHLAPDVKRRKYSAQLKKTLLFEDVKRKAMQAAQQTETLADDKEAAKLDVEDTEGLVYNDGVTGEDYVNKTLAKYCS